jgi:hypothetical protein
VGCERAHCHSQEGQQRAGEKEEAIHREAVIVIRERTTDPLCVGELIPSQSAG